MKKGLSLLLIVVLALTMVLAGCGSTEEGTTNEGTAAPVESVTWKVQGYTGAGTFFDQAGMQLAERINGCAGGRLVIDWYAADTIVAVAEGANAVRDGILDGAWDYPGLYLSIDWALPLFCSSPGLFGDALDMYGWMTSGGGEALYQEIWDDYSMNGHTIYAGQHDQEDWLWSNFPIETIDDMKGHTLRMMPLMGTVLAENDLSVAFVSGTEIVSSMERGVIDAGEYSIPALDKTFGFQDVAKYYARPGIHQPTSTQFLNIGVDKWNALPDDLKRIVETCCKEQVLTFYQFGVMGNLEAMKFFEEQGITQTTLTDETVETLLGWVDAFYDKYCNDPDQKWLGKVHQSQVDYIKKVAAYKDSCAIPYPEWAYED